jgi:cytochrome c oxidase assembly protein subunit 15
VVRVLRPLTSFQRHAIWTTATTYFLILVGGLVRASGAGLGCPDWPRCFGSWIPPASAAELPPGFDAAQFNPTLMWTEYLNRLLGASVGLLIFATLISAVRHHRRTGRILWPTLAAFLLVGFQGWLGGVVVQQELAAWIVTVHLLVALVIVALLLYATVYAFFAGGPTASPLTAERRRQLSWMSLAVIVVTLVQVTLGAQVRGGIDQALDAGTRRADALASVGRIDLWHRETALLVLLMTGVIGALVWRRHLRERPLVLSALAVTGLVLTQIALGFVMAYVTLTPAAQIAHLTSSSLLLGAETVLFLLLRWLPD